MNIKVMTFNLRTPVKNDGVNYFPNREENILAAIESENPDLIGFQEAADYSRAFLKRSLSDYVVIGCGRNKDYTGEACFSAGFSDCSHFIAVFKRKFGETPHKYKIK